MFVRFSGLLRRRKNLRTAIGFGFIVCLVFALILVVSNVFDYQERILAEPVSPHALAVGTNLSRVADWSTQQPLIDAFKSARFWLPQCAVGEPGCQGGWATEETNLLDLDEHGWVKTLPKPEDPPEYTYVGTLLFREIDGHYPGGQYVVLYDGEGRLEYQYDAKKDEAASQPGRDVINVTPSHEGIYLMIKATDPRRTGNYIRNIRVIPIEYEQNYQSLIFNPVFLDRIRPFKTLRFMDWMQTNNSPQSRWEDRPQLDDAFYSTDKGVPLELMIELCNRLQANPWFNMPHQATDDYMVQFAQVVKQQLDPKLTIYVELSNEVWNWMFQQAHYALEQAKARWNVEGDGFMQWYGMRTAQMADLWKQAFGGENRRVIPVMGTQTGWRGLEEGTLSCPLWVAEASGRKPCYQHVEAFAITGYFSGNLGQDETLDQVLAWTRDPRSGFPKAIQQLKAGNLLGTEDHADSLVSARDAFGHFKQVADQHGLQLFVYEGGQHLTRPDNDQLTKFYIELNRRPEMYDLYTELLRSWQAAGGSLFMNFSDISRPDKWGSWGVLEYVEQPHSPKYDALVDFIDREAS